MKRFLAALTFCTFLLAAGALLLTRPTRAKEDVISQLLSLPAPPPAGSNAKRTRSWRQPDKKNPPKDDAPIAEILNYWEAQSASYRDLGYNPKPSPQVLERIRTEIEKKPESVVRFVNIFRDSPEGVDLVKRIYDNWPENAKGGQQGRSALKSWLLTNSPHFSDQLSRTAVKAGEQGEYVSNQGELLALTQHDWDAARPTVDRLYSDASSPVSRVLGMWALYKHALTEDSLGDIDGYRRELMDVVEDKKATAGMRDLAFDALVKEKDWNGRDEWYYTLLADETLAELRVNGSVYTGLTTMIIYAHPDKYAEKMIELSKSSNSVVRNAAIRNLAVILDEGRPDVIRALLPLLEDPKSAKDFGPLRNNLVRVLRSTKVPESVPGLVAGLDETETIYIDEAMSNMNAASNAANMAANAIASAANAVARAANTATYRVSTNANVAGSGKMREMTRYPLRSDAIHALALQADPRAAQPLKRIMRDVEPYERSGVVKAILASKGFTVAEQADAVESMAREAKRAKEEFDEYRAVHGANAYSNMVMGDVQSPLLRMGGAAFNAEEMRLLLGMQLTQTPDPGDALIREVVARISRFEKTEPELAQALRSILLGWKGQAVNALLLKDLKDGKSSAEAIVKLLSVRKSLQETQSSDVFDIRTGDPAAVGISACLLESDRDYAAVLSGVNAEAKAAMLACARLIRAKLPVKTVAGYLSAEDKRLALAAERYLEGEDSPEARKIVHSLAPNDVRILGATTAFWPDGKYETALGSWALTILESGEDEEPETDPDGMLMAYRYLQRSRITDFDDDEKRIKDELKADEKLTAVYSYDGSYVHIYKDRVVFSWDEDESRYRERAMTKDEFEHLTGYMTDNRVDELGPFLSCGDECESKMLLMVGRHGGRRVFYNSDADAEFFDGLESIFSRMQKEPAKLHYRLEKEIPGLEILFADDAFSIETIWKNGTDFRLLAADAEKRRKIDEEIEEAPEMEEDVEESVSEKDEVEYIDPERERRFEGLAWYRFTDGRLSEQVLQPDGIDFPPGPDGLGRWKAKAGGIEVKIDKDGLTKTSAGKAARLRSGNYESPVISANGKWAFATKFTDNGASLWRINVTTKREYAVESKDMPAIRALAFVPAINKFLVTPNYYEGSEEYDEGYVQGNRPYLLIDPETGAVQRAVGDLRPLAQQAFRPLQPASGAFEFWAAIPDLAARKTSVGVYNAKTLTFKEVLSVPKIIFQSMQMWADPTGGRIYFVYKGHLLALPLPSAKTK